MLFAAKMSDSVVRVDVRSVVRDVEEKFVDMMVEF